MEYLWLTLGFGILLFAGKLLVQGSVVIADSFKVSKLVIGLTVVSMGTSAPEMFVSALAAYKGDFDVTVGNVVGSNLANIGLVLSITVLIFPMLVKRATVTINTPFMLLVSGLLYLFVLNGSVSFVEGAAMFIILGFYVFLLIRYSRKNPIASIEDVPEQSLPIWRAIIYIVLATVGLAFGADLLIVNAKIVALSWGVSERVVSITVLAFGTSLPELATSAIAAFRKEMDISVGNIVGSNIFNILAVLGVSSMVKAVEVNESFIQFDIPSMLIISGLLFLFILPANNSKLTRWKGLVLLASYTAYVIALFLR